MNVNANQIVGQITGLIAQAISIALLLLIAAAVAGKFGFRVPMLPASDPISLAWLCGAWWLYRGGRLG